MIVNKTVPPKGKKETRCCIDLGSSYFRLLSVTGRFGPRGFEAEGSSESRTYVGWGEGIAAAGAIGREAADTAADALLSLVEEARGTGCASLRVVSTNALRASSDRAAVKARLEEISGVKIDVLSPKGEAFLGFAGAASLLEPGSPAITADPGGTSTEIAWGLAPSAGGYACIPAGTHTAAALLDRGPGIVSKGGWHGPSRRALPALIAGMMIEARVPAGDSPLPGAEENPTIIIIGGTAVSIGIVWRFMSRSRGPENQPTWMTADMLKLTGKRLSALFRSGRERRLPLPPERIGLLVPGFALLSGVLSGLSAERVCISTRDLRWGILLGEEGLERGYLADEQASPDS